MIGACVNSTVRHVILVGAIGVGIGAYFAVGGNFLREEKPIVNEASATTKAGPAARGGWAMSPFGTGQAPKGNVGSASTDMPQVYGHNGHPVDFEGLTAAQYVARWSALARSGNPEAAYKTYLAESVCAGNDEQAAKFDSSEEQEEFLRERDDLRKMCSGVTPAQVQERLHFLAIAARSGNARAQVDFYMEGPEGQAAAEPEDRNDPLLQQWKDDAFANLQAAASQGELRALALLAQTYSSGELTSRDMKMALAYTVADATARNADLSQSQLQKQFGTQMSATDFQSALQSGVQIAHDCCGK